MRTSLWPKQQFHKDKVKRGLETLGNTAQDGNLKIFLTVSLVETDSKELGFAHPV